MGSRSPMIQVYRDNEEGSVGEHAPFLSSEPPAASSQPRWAKASTRRTRFRRIALAAGTFVTIYLLFCTWYTLSHSETHYDAMEGGFHHPKLPWPFPHPPPHHPHHPPPPPPGPPHHPHHPHFFPPKPVVLGCTAVPTPSSLNALESATLEVTIPGHKAVVLHDHLLFGNVSVSKVAPETEVAAESEGKTLEVRITVANLTFPHPHPPPSLPDGLELEEEEEDKEPEAFVLCAMTFKPRHPPRRPDAELMAIEELPEGHPHHPPPHPPFFPPVIVTVLPAHNETYPKLPGHCPHHPPGHPPHGPPEEPEMAVEISHSTVFSRALRSTIAFLFPMLRLSHDSSFSKHMSHPRFPHHPPPPPPPPPPFAITSVTVTVPQFVPVKYGVPFGGPFPPPPPHHPRHWA